MVAQSRTSFSLKNNCLFEFYFFAGPQANHNIVFELYLEKPCREYNSTLRQSVGWLFAPIICLPKVIETMEPGQILHNKFILLQGSPRMLIDASKAKFKQCISNIEIGVDSERLA